MLDGMWKVYLPDGTYLGCFETRIGNEVLMLNSKTAAMLSIGDTLRIEETHTTRKWEIRITGQYRDKPTEFTIEKISDLF